MQQGGNFALQTSPDRVEGQGPAHLSFQMNQTKEKSANFRVFARQFSVNFKDHHVWMPKCLQSLPCDWLIHHLC
ncbi:hypothetical protein ATANTOWER_004923 [Ataeniobius toweri]|uniref:Uncharacterized protein n=1 Tax=Ataeniobius toweri TaxID=208326 RepID=A0ABU7B4S0_9TELE|nr:hypothetical protein [Ataeniobius toweri]